MIPSILYPMVIDNEIMDALSAPARVNPRLRQSVDLRNSPEDRG